MGKESFTDIPITLDGKQMWLSLSEEGERRLDEMARRYPGLTPQELLDKMVEDKAK